ncbi:MAG: hypothetical protein FWE25_03355 [Lachnospiraceae bacterium]|nr:hypothetical protein [Lachnospiraceae bacterium]
MKKGELTRISKELGVAGLEHLTTHEGMTKDMQAALKSTAPEQGWQDEVRAYLGYGRDVPVTRQMQLVKAVLEKAIDGSEKHARLAMEMANTATVADHIKLAEAKTKYAKVVAEISDLNARTEFTKATTEELRGHYGIDQIVNWHGMIREGDVVYDESD